MERIKTGEGERDGKLGGREKRGGRRGRIKGVTVRGAGDERRPKLRQVEKGEARAGKVEGRREVDGSRRSAAKNWERGKNGNCD